MEIRELHRWDLSVDEARALQRRLAPQVIRQGDPSPVHLVAGADIAVGPRGDEGPARGVAVVLGYPSLDLIEASAAELPLRFPYIPGLLAFREIPVLVEAFRALTSRPDLVLVDGQGIAHPRRFGIACHLGLLLDLPTIGCAKSRLIGSHGPVGEEAGSWVPLRDGSETIGAVVRTRTGVKPLYVSVGHKIGIEAAVEWVLRCCRGRRLPEPTRLADQRAGRRA